MSDINYWHDEYSKEMDQLSLFVEKLKGLIASSNVRAIDSCCKECDSKATRVREVKKSFMLELRLVKDRDVRNEFDAKAKLLEQRFDELGKFVLQTKNNNGKKDLIGADSSGSRNLYSTEGKDNDALLGEANKLQDKTFESLGRTRNMIEASREIGTATIEQLRGQREQIIEIDAEVDRLDTHLVRAEKLVFNFTKRMASDKIIRGFFCINIFVMLSLVLYVGISGKSLSPSSGSGGGGSGPTQSNSPTFLPSSMPTLFWNATGAPSHLPSFVPTLEPTAPTDAPTAAPSALPSITFAPTAVPTTAAPSQAPTLVPSALPTSSFSPSAAPTVCPSQLPTVVPSLTPIFLPSLSPSLVPTVNPSTSPSLTPSVLPTLLPTEVPT